VIDRRSPFGLGWLPDVVDVVNDYLLSVPLLSTLPDEVDLRDEHMPPVKSQGPLGSCTAFATTAAFLYAASRQGQPGWDISELYQYYWSRYLMGRQYVGIDSGATTTAAIKALAKFGACQQALWPYALDRFSEPPPPAAREDASHHQVLRYETCPRSERAVKSVLASRRAVVFGASLYESFEYDRTLKTGEIPVPRPGEKLLGGHEMVWCGYRKDGYLITRNSWGAGIGDSGYMFMPPEVAYSGAVRDIKVIDLVEVG
jgi:C1A family cysteine protease